MGPFEPFFPLPDEVNCEPDWAPGIVKFACLFRITFCKYCYCKDVLGCA